ncbi:hypothetical protein H8S95_15465 [Pontibacter sp. KCTC 32443]|uniref:hypothetical protein n=1 Tax=Pontibacter TaxID=323449 RepID=UPI00164E709C|nr:MULTISPECIES: hypothetical protein [Pontibacter]MBC5775475.1 hypothetical protein [Pontibacter sp. KCTC 32443]
MKQFKLLVLSALTFLIYSCDKEDNIFSKDGNNENGTALECDNLTFETVDAGNYIDQIHTEDGYGPIRVYGKAMNSDGNLVADNRAMIFDSENWTGDDDDLTADWGKVLIIQELGIEGEPNDNQWGGEIMLTFPEPVTIKSLRVLDIDNREGDNENNSWVFLYDGTGKEVYKRQMVPLGDNSKQTIDLGNTAGVVTVKVLLDGEGIVGSAAIDNIEFCAPTDGEEEEEKYGCTRLRSYWIEHADPATEEYNSAWNAYRQTAFYSSGSNYLEMLQKTPAKGNAYFMLAQTYITATLNIKSGASTTLEVDEAMAGATAFFKGETEPSVAQLLVWAGLLDAYNEGEVGPGMCKD